MTVQYCISHCLTWTTVCKTVRPMLSDRYKMSCNAGVLPNGWVDQDATWYGGDRPRLRPRTLGGVRWGPTSSPTKRGTAVAVPYFRVLRAQACRINHGPYILWPNGRPSQQLLSSCFLLENVLWRSSWLNCDQINPLKAASLQYHLWMLS